SGRGATVRRGVAAGGPAGPAVPQRVGGAVHDGGVHVADRQHRPGSRLRDGAVARCGRCSAAGAAGYALTRRRGVKSDLNCPFSKGEWIMSRTIGGTAILLIGLLTGCNPAEAPSGSSPEKPNSDESAVRAKYLLASEPAGARSVPDICDPTKTKEGAEVTVI